MEFNAAFLFGSSSLSVPEVISHFDACDTEFCFALGKNEECNIKTCYLFSTIVRVKVVFRKTVVGD